MNLQIYWDVSQLRILIKCNYSDMHINKTPSQQDLCGSRARHPGQFIIFCNNIVIATLLCILPLVFLSLHFSLSLPLF